MPGPRQLDLERAARQVAAAGFVALFLCAASANALTIIIVPVPPDPTPRPPPPSVSYSVTDLPDITPGQNLFRYDYSLDHFLVSAAGAGFKVLFDPAHYALLQYVPPALGPELYWAVTSVEPIAGYRDGYFYAAARVAYPSRPLAGFSVDFVWLGTGIPGSQEFEIFGDYDRYLVAKGATTPVPEPSTGLFVIAGLLALGGWRRARD